MIRKENNGVAWLEFELFQNYPEIRHGIFLRQGGVSTGHYDSLNFAQKTGESHENVLKNTKIALDAVGLPRFYTANQVHGIKCLSNFQECEQDADLLFTNEKAKALLVRHADCQAALVYDPVKKVVAAVHAGWRGMVADIYQEMVLFFQTTFGSKASNLLVAISPSLSPEASEFKHFEKEFPKEFHPFQVKPTYFNLWEIARYQLEKAGISKDNIQIASLCTYHNPELFFSYRRKAPTGCHGAFISMQP